MAKYDYRQSSKEPSSTALARDPWADRPQIPYILPYLVFILVMMPGSLGHIGGIDWEHLWKTYLPVEYALKSVLAALLLWYFWPWYTRIQWRRIDLGILAGLFGTVLWIVSEYACQKVGLASPPKIDDIYNPDVMLPNDWQRLAFLCIRVAGPALVVPFMEELFFRDFIMRSLVGGTHFQDVPIGKFTWPSFLGMSVLFGINHGFSYFIPGLLYGFLMGILLIRTKSLGACIIAHGITNWTLYLYCIYTGNWQFM